MKEGYRLFSCTAVDKLECIHKSGKKKPNKFSSLLCLFTRIDPKMKLSFLPGNRKIVSVNAVDWYKVTEDLPKDVPRETVLN